MNNIMYFRCIQRYICRELILRNVSLLELYETKNITLTIKTMHQMLYYYGSEVFKLIWGVGRGIWRVVICSYLTHLKKLTYDASLYIMCSVGVTHLLIQLANFVIIVEKEIDKLLPSLDIEPNPSLVLKYYLISYSYIRIQCTYS